MKTSRNIWQKQALRTIRGGMLTAGFLLLLCVPHTVITASAENYSNPGEWYQMACLGGAFWAEAQKAALTEKVKITADIVVAEVTVDNDEKGSVSSPEETDVEAKTITENMKQ
jgi:hypothetical protein